MRESALQLIPSVIASCDCDVEIEALAHLMLRIQPLEGMFR